MQMLWSAIPRLIREDAGMEMIEWSLVGVIFAVGSAIVWSTLKTPLNSGITDIGNCVGSSALCH
jgi:Flp pilus assembly pilin Flp